MKVGKMIFVMVSLAVWACGPSISTVRVAYQSELSRCNANEHAIVARAGTTAEEDASDMRAERERCDAARNAILDSCGRRCR